MESTNFKIKINDQIFDMRMTDDEDLCESWKYVKIGDEWVRSDDKRFPVRLTQIDVVRISWTAKEGQLYEI